MDVLMLKLEAPLMSFGGTMVDSLGVLTKFPSASLLTGLVANALGYDQSQFGAHTRLQERLRFAARIDRPGQRLVDYQTVDLGQPQFAATGWTTRGHREERRGGSASTGTHIRSRPYWAGRCCVVACTLAPAGEAPTMEQVAQALERPVRPLFLGRKACLPATPLLAGHTVAETLLSALLAFPAAEGAAETADAVEVEAQWPEEEPLPAGVIHHDAFTVTDQRDWPNQFHSGSRMVRQGLISIPGRLP